MRAWLQRLLGSRPGRRANVTCYLRENGPIAYEFDLFGRAPRERAEAMFGSGLAWAWKSGAREWTELTRISLSAFLADLPQGVLLIGAEGELPTAVSDGLVKDWIRRFSRAHPGPLAAVIRAAQTRHLLFVQQHAADSVNALLEEWGLDKRAAVRRAYPRLGAETLEALGETL